MKRRISLVIALFVSFLLMFSPIAAADETKVSTVTTSEPIEVEVVKIPSAKMSKAVSSPPQEKTSDNILEGEKDINKREKNIGKSRGPCGECRVEGTNIRGNLWILILLLVLCLNVKHADEKKNCRECF
jgi:hypothetical protein